MKKFFRLMLSAAVIASVASCAKDVSVAPADQFVDVEFVADLGGSLGSRAIADGTTVDEVAWAIYDHDNDELLQNLQGTLVLVDKKATLNVRLATGKIYDIAFFAYKAGTAAVNSSVDPIHYNVNWAEKTVYVKPDTKLANDETLDCFWYVKEELKVEGPIQEEFTLKRPLAQLNIGVTKQDIEDAKDAGFEVLKSQITVSSYSQFNLFDGSVAGSTYAPVIFTENLSPVNAADILTVENDNTEYKYLATTYLLVNNKETCNVKVTLWDTNDAELNTLDYSFVPFQRNYRTNILGALLTNPATFTIVIDEKFNKPDNIKEVVE